MAIYDPDQPDTVEGRMEGLLSKDSSYMARARAGARQTAEQRGLLSSSIAATAGEKAAIESALPIAQQEAAQAHARTLQAGEFEQETAVETAGQAHQAGLLETQGEQKQRLLEESLTAEREMTTEKIAGAQEQTKISAAGQARAAAAGALTQIGLAQAEEMSLVGTGRYTGSGQWTPYTADDIAARFAPSINLISSIVNSSLSW